jgi:glycosyltransferase involved in cell wall biosynthesis
MVSRNRFDVARAGIESYLAQSYLNKELIIIRDIIRDPPSVVEFETGVRDLGRPDIRVIRASDAVPLNALRNASMENANGEVLCQWDDDDYSHPDRLRIQLDAMMAQGSPACYLQDTFDYDIVNGAMYWLDWSPSPLRCHPGTVMYRSSLRMRYAEVPGYTRASEDTLLCLSFKKPVTLVGGAPYLFVYSWHGHNTWKEDHRALLRRKLVRSLDERHDLFARELDRVGLPVSVASNGPDVRYFRSRTQRRTSPNP